ncbi:MAG: N-acetylmuramoyl-L-alanine amidase [Casimicrobiaceae bacterium]
MLPATGFIVPDLWAQAVRIASARVWPAEEYTRVIVESGTPLVHAMFALKNPERLVIDLDGVDLSPEIATISSRVQASDPYLGAIRVGRKSATTLRLVFDLKTEVKPDLFALPPVGEIGHRLVLDLYPPVPLDPLMALLQAERVKERTASAPVDGAPEKPGERPASKSADNVAERQPEQAADKLSLKPGEKPAPRARTDARTAPAARRITIAIDPGHGGEDPGAIGPRGTHEKDVVLAISRKLKSLIDAQPNMRAMLTRDADYFVPLAQRVQKARRVQADLFISVHADAFREARARGSSVFALSESGATSAAAKWLAQKENEADLIGGVDLDRRDPVLARTLLDLSQTAQISDSLKVGRHVLEGIGTHNTLHKASVEQAGFAVLKAPDIPSILVETAFISNPDEEQKLRSERHQQKFAESMHGGIARYFARNPPLARA